MCFQTLLNPVLLFGIIFGFYFPSESKSYKFYSRVIMILVSTLVLYTMARFTHFFYASWLAHDVHETPLNFANVLIISAIGLNIATVVHFSQSNSDHLVNLIFKLEKLANKLDFYNSNQYKKLYVILRIRYFICICFQTSMKIYNPFLWPDYFKLFDLLGLLIGEYVSFIFELQFVSLLDLFQYILIDFNVKLRSSRKNVPFLRLLYSDICELFEQFESLLGLFSLAAVIYLFISITMCSYFLLSMQIEGKGFLKIFDLDLMVLAGVIRLFDFARACSGPAKQVCLILVYLYLFIM